VPEFTTSQSAEAEYRRLKPPQFGLRTLLGGIAVWAALLVVGQWLSPAVILTLALLAGSIFCHVMGNAIGTRLRQMGDLPDVGPKDDARTNHGPPQARDFAPATHLSERRSLGLTVIVAASIGLACGAVGGGLWTFVASNGQANAPSIAVGVVAFSILGGIAAFAVVSFMQVLLGAIWQAIR
jgi:hypothetical protein